MCEQDDASISAENNVAYDAAKKEDDDMSTLAPERYCTIEESLIESCKEVRLIREGKAPFKTWAELRADIQRMKTEGAGDELSGKSNSKV